MLEIRTLFNAARPFGAADPALKLKVGEGVLWGRTPKQIGPAALVVEVSAQIPEGVEPIPFRFLASDRNFYRKNGRSDLLRGGHYRHIRTAALTRAIEKVSTFRRLLPPPGKLDYSQFPTQSAMVEDVRVGPLHDPESVAVFVELLTGDGKKIVAFGRDERKKKPTEKAGLALIASDKGVVLDPELRSALEAVSLKELRRLGVPV